MGNSFGSRFPSGLVFLLLSLTILETKLCFFNDSAENFTHIHIQVLNVIRELKFPGASHSLDILID